MLNTPEETSYIERNRICRIEEIWQGKHQLVFEAIDEKEQGPEREEEMRRFWWAFNNDNFTLMYDQEMNALIDHKLVQKRQKGQQDKLNKLSSKKKK